MKVYVDYTARKFTVEKTENWYQGATTNQIVIYVKNDVDSTSYSVSLGLKRADNRELNISVKDFGTDDELVENGITYIIHRFTLPALACSVAGALQITGRINFIALNSSNEAYVTGNDVLFTTVVNIGKTQGYANNDFLYYETEGDAASILHSYIEDITKLFSNYNTLSTNVGNINKKIYFLNLTSSIVSEDSALIYAFVHMRSATSPYSVYIAQYDGKAMFLLNQGITSNTASLLLIAPNGDISTVTQTQAQYTVSQYTKTYSGHVSTAESADQATKDANGNVITETYATKTDNDAKVNTTDIKDNLTSTDADKPLAAHQGKVLYDMIVGVQKILASDNTDFDTLQEIVNYITSNKDAIALITSKADKTYVDAQDAAMLSSAKNYADTNKVAKESGKGLSEQNFTADEKSKLANLQFNSEGKLLPKCIDDVGVNVDNANNDGDGNNIAANYLKKADAASTYETQADAENTFAKKTDVAGFKTVEKEVTLTDNIIESSYTIDELAKNVYIDDNGVVRGSLGKVSGMCEVKYKNYLKSLNGSVNISADEQSAVAWITLTAGTYYYGLWTNSDVSFLIKETSGWSTIFESARNKSTKLVLSADTSVGIYIYSSSAVSCSYQITKTIAEISSLNDLADTDSLVITTPQTIKNVGKNLFNQDSIFSKYDGATTIPLPKISGTFTVSTKSNWTYAHLVHYPLGQDIVSSNANESATSLGASKSTATFTIDTNYDYYLVFSLGSNGYKPTKADFLTYELRLNFGSADLGYTEYTETTLSLDTMVSSVENAGYSLGVNAYDFVNKKIVGRLYDNVAKIIDLGDLDYTYYSSSNLFRATISDINSNDLLCANYPTSSYDTRYDKSIYYNSYAGKVIDIMDSGYTDATSFKTAMKGIKLVYETINASVDLSTNLQESDIMFDTVVGGSFILYDSSDNYISGINIGVVLDFISDETLKGQVSNLTSQIKENIATDKKQQDQIDDLSAAIKTYEHYVSISYSGYGTLRLMLTTKSATALTWSTLATLLKTYPSGIQLPAYGDIKDRTNSIYLTINGCTVAQYGGNTRVTGIHDKMKTMIIFELETKLFIYSSVDGTAYDTQSQSGSTFTDSVRVVE